MEVLLGSGGVALEDDEESGTVESCETLEESKGGERGAFRDSEIVLGAGRLGGRVVLGC